MRNAAFVVVFLCALAPFACQRPQRHVHYATLASDQLDTAHRARQANADGLTAAENQDFQAAEALFRQALAADLHCASAHNNLGLVLLHRRAYYEAALEFNFARKIRPGAVEPILNLARLYETVGWHRAALDEYDRALAIDDRCAEALGRSARVLLFTAEDPEKARERLARLARASSDSPWRQWALVALNNHEAGSASARNTSFAPKQDESGYGKEAGPGS